MRMDVARKNWSFLLHDFNIQNLHRRTRLEVIGEAGDVMRDYWMENGLPLLGVSLEENVPAAPCVEIALGGQGAHDGHLTHVVSRVLRVAAERNYEGGLDALEFEDHEGRCTILRCETHGAAAVAV